jgi:hypothetical protein
MSSPEMARKTLMGLRYKKNYIMEKTLKKDVDFKKSKNKVALVNHIYENFDSYITSGTITTQDFLANPDYDSAKHFSREKTLPQPKVETVYNTEIINKFWMDLLKNEDIISKMYKNSDDDGEYIYKVGEVSKWRNTIHEFKRIKGEFEPDIALISMIKYHLSDQLAMRMYSAWGDYDEYLKIKSFIQQFKEKPIVERRKDYYTDEFNGVIGNEISFEDDVWSDDRDSHSITLSFGVSSYGYTVGKLLEVTFNFRDTNRGLLYKQKGEAKLHYNIKGSRYDENKSVSLLTGDLVTRWTGTERKVVNYKMTNRWSETRRTVNFTTYILDHRQWVKSEKDRVQTEQRREVFLLESKRKLQEKFPKCEVYTADKTGTTYGSNGYSVKRYGHCNVIVKYPNGSKIIYDLSNACTGDLVFRGAFDSEYVKAEHNEEHFIELFKKQNDDS